MNDKTEQGLFEVLEAELRKAEVPLDCADLFDRPAVRDHAATVNRVSDYLGNLWRKGKVMRVPAPRVEGTKARWMYVWKDKGPKVKQRPSMADAMEFNEPLQHILSKPNLDITDDGRRITIMLPELIITIQKRSN